jgi:hypothetical protein
MRISFDDEERALLARRLGQSDAVNDAALAASFQAWFEGKPTPPGGRRLTATDLEGLHAVADYAALDDRGPGNSDAATGW